MPKKYSRRSMKGGMFEGLTSGWDSFKDWGSGAWGKLMGSDKDEYKSTPYYGTANGYNGTANGTANGYNGTANGTANGYNGTANGYNGTANGYNGTPGYGGKKRRRKSRKMRGGNFTDNTPTTGLAFHAAPFSGETARPNTWVGGKTRKRRKSCRKR
jgi:hypothetical protein